MFTGTNYCGPGGSGKVLGEVDDACSKHDAAYKKGFYLDYFKSQDADKVFLRRMWNARPDGVRQHLTRGIALGYFSSKVKFWDSMEAGPVMVWNPQHKVRQSVKRKAVKMLMPNVPYEARAPRRATQMKRRVLMSRRSYRFKPLGSRYPRFKRAFGYGKRLLFRRKR